MNLNLNSEKYYETAVEKKKMNSNSEEYCEVAAEKKILNSLIRLLRFLLEPNQAVLCTVLEELVGV